MKISIIRGAAIITDNEGNPLPAGTIFHEEPMPKLRGPKLSVPSKEKFFSDAFSKAREAGETILVATGIAHQAVFLAPSLLHMFWNP